MQLERSVDPGAGRGKAEPQIRTAKTRNQNVEKIGKQAQDASLDVNSNSYISQGNKPAVSIVKGNTFMRAPTDHYIGRENAYELNSSMKGSIGRDMHIDIS